MHNIPNFKITPHGKISQKFMILGYNDFQAASLFIKNLPYKRNTEKSNILCVLTDFGGTCSTKHALLKNLATENNFTELRLMLGIFKMNSTNTPKISAVLAKYKIEEVPEAHNYLKYKNEITDCNRKNSSPEDFIHDLLVEAEINPSEITDFKIQYHRNFLSHYLQKKPQIPYSIEEFWNIREECILALQQ